MMAPDQIETSGGVLLAGLARMGAKPGTWMAAMKVNRAARVPTIVTPLGCRRHTITRDVVVTVQRSACMLARSRCRGHRGAIIATVRQHEQIVKEHRAGPAVASGGVLAFGSFGAKNNREVRATATIEDICCRENPPLQCRDDHR